MQEIEFKSASSVSDMASPRTQKQAHHAAGGGGGADILSLQQASCSEGVRAGGRGASSANANAASGRKQHCMQRLRCFAVHGFHGSARSVGQLVSRSPLTRCSGVCLHWGVQAVEIGLEGVYEFNACVPYAGLAPGLGARVDATTINVCLALLHPDVVPGERAAAARAAMQR